MSVGPFIIGNWRADPSTNRLTRDDEVVELEPRVMDLLVLFSGSAGQTLSKQEIADALWGDVGVNDDALTRTLWKLRQGLGDNAKAPRFIETVPKRGYRLIASVEPMAQLGTPERVRPPFELIGLAVVLIGLIAALLVLPMLRTAPSVLDASLARVERADAFYAQYTRVGNEAARRLYEAVLEDDPQNAPALAGLSNVVAQSVIRFTGPDGAQAERTSLTEALESGWLDDPQAQAALERSVALARQATQIDPAHGRGWRALGLAQAAQGAFEEAELSYNRALVINPEDWGSLVNLSDIASLSDQPERSLSYLQRAYDAMERRFAQDAVLVRPWQSRLGLAIAKRLSDQGDTVDAELWYRRVISADPLNEEAIQALAELLRRSGDAQGAQALCADLQQQTGQTC